MSYTLELMNKKAFTLDEEKAKKLKSMLLSGNLSGYIEIDGNIVATHQIIGVFREEEEVERYPRLAAPKMTPEQLKQRDEVINKVRSKLKWTRN